MTDTTTDVHTEHEDRMRAWFGLRPSTAPACPRVAAGKRCQAHTGDLRCACRRHAWLLDHARAWLDEHGRHVVTAEPYNRDGAEVAAYIADCAELGLSVHVDGRSPWNPGATFLLLARREDR